MYIRFKHSQLKLVEPYTEEEFKSYFQCRWEILRKPWNQPKGSEIDDKENVSLHVMAIEKNDIIGVGRLTILPDQKGQIRYMGVKENMQGKKVGSKILTYLEKEAQKLNITEIMLNARENAVPFYKSNGYNEKGKSYLLWDEIQHFEMTKTL